MAKVTWKGAIKLGFINIPVGAIAVAESGEKISFNQLHDACKGRISQKKWCVKCEKEVGTADEPIVKGYEHVKGSYVVIAEADIARVKVSSERTVNLNVPKDVLPLDPLLIDKSYFLVPDNKLAQAAYHVVRRALGARYAIGTVCMSGSEKQVAITQRGDGLMMHVLNEAREVRNIDNLEQLRDVPALKEEEVQLAQMLMDQLSEDINLSDFEDSYKKNLRAMIQAKIDGQEFTMAADSEVPAPAAASLADMLRNSLESVAGFKAKKAQAKAELPTTVEVLVAIGAAARHQEASEAALEKGLELAAAVGVIDAPKPKAKRVKKVA